MLIFQQHTHCKRFPNCFPPSLLRLSIRRMRKTCLSIRIFEVQFVLRMLLSSWSLWLVVYYDVIPCRLWGLKFWLVGRWFLKHVSKLLVSLLAGGHSRGAGAELSLHVLYDFCTCSFQVFQGHLDSLAVSTIQALTAVMHKSPAAKVTVSMHRAVRSFFILFAVTPWWILLMEMSRLCSHIHAR